MIELPPALVLYPTLAIPAPTKVILLASTDIPLVLPVVLLVAAKLKVWLV